MLLGLRTVVFAVADLPSARAWYAALLGFAPYFDQPFYVGFSVGGCELGLVPAEPGDATGTGADVPYWAVGDVPHALGRLQELGAQVVQGATDVGGGIVLAHVQDPFGNTLGVIDNPHFRADLGQPAAGPGEVDERTIVHEVRVAAPPARVFALWTSSEGLAAWWHDKSRIELCLGGAMELYFLDEEPRGLQGSEGCRITAWLPDRMLAFTWNAPPDLPTRRFRTFVVLELTAVEGGTEVRLTHAGWPAAGLQDPDSGWPATFAYFDRAWGRVLHMLVDHLGAA